MGTLWKGEKAAAVYPPELCVAICRGFRLQQTRDKKSFKTTASLLSVEVMSMIAQGQYPSHWVDEHHENDGISRKRDEADGQKIHRKQLHKIGCRMGDCRPEMISLAPT